MASFGTRIKQMRRAVNLTQKELVERLANAGYPVGQPLISFIENDKRMPPYHGLSAFAKVLQVDQSELFRLAGYSLPSQQIHQSKTDIFFRSHTDPEPSLFDERLYAIEQRAGPRYILYPVESYVSRPPEQIQRQQEAGRSSLAFWQQRRAVFEQHLRNGQAAYHLHSIPDLLQLDEARGVETNWHCIALLRALQNDLRRFPAFHMGLAPAGLNLAFFLKQHETEPTGVIAAYPRNWGYRPTRYLEGLYTTDAVVVNGLLEEFLALWHDPATLTDRAAVDEWLDQQCARLASQGSDPPPEARVVG